MPFLLISCLFLALQPVAAPKFKQLPDNIDVLRCRTLVRNTFRRERSGTPVVHVRPIT